MPIAMTQLFFGSTEVRDFEHLLRQVPDEELKNLTRSTLPLLAYWRDTERATSALLTGLFGAHESSPSSVSFEHEVPSYGDNNPSFTDVMYVSEQTAIAIEGKWSEPMYPVVSKWLREGKSLENRRNVVDHWMKLIRNQTGFINEQQVENVVYQLLHRTASACSLGRSRCAVVYQLFTEDGRKTNEYVAALKTMAAATGMTERLAVWVHEVSLKPAANQEAVATRVAASSGHERADVLRAAILAGSLFSFGAERFLRVGSP